MSEADVSRRREEILARYERLSLVAMLRDFAEMIQARACEFDGSPEFTAEDIRALYDLGQDMEALAEALDGGPVDSGEVEHA